MTIERVHGVYKGRCRAVAYGGLVYAVATDQSNSKGMAAQTRKTLAALEKNLVDAGSGKDRILQATIYITDLALKYEMDDVWCEWIGEEANWPQRACVGAQLAGETLVEITVTAAMPDAPSPPP